MASEIKVDTISEKTSANGVSIDGLKIKDVTSGSVMSKPILQIVTGTTNTDTGAITSESYTDTGLSASITPSSTSSKIMVMVSQTLGAERNNSGGVPTEVYGYVNIMKDTTQIWEGFFAGHIKSLGQTHISFVDSPSSTSSITYKTQIKVYPDDDGGKVRAQQDSGLSNRMSSIHLIEIAG